MAKVGVAATAFAGLVALGVGVLAIRSIPDAKRYLKMRSM